MNKNSFKTALLFCGLLISCRTEMTRCLSSSPDLAFFAEQFNISQRQHKVEFIYTGNCREELQGENLPDLVIDWNITDTAEQLDYKTLRSELGKKSQYYRALLKSGEVRGRQKLVPLSFNLPLLSYNHNPGRPEFPLVLPLQEVSNHAAAFNKKHSRAYSRIGFSPAWSRDSLYLAYKVFGLQYADLPEGFTVDKESLIKAEASVNSWLESLIPDPKQAQLFNDKYIYTEGYRLLEDRRVLFFYYPANAYFRINEQNRRRLLFSWITDGESIPVDEKVLYAAIPDKSPNSAGASAFLTWLLRPGTQRLLLQAKNSSGKDSFGLFEGFSSIRLTNEEVFPQIYPQLKERMPTEQQLIFPVNSPAGLIDAREELISNWMMERLLGKNELELAAALDKWQKQQTLYR